MCFYVAFFELDYLEFLSFYFFCDAFLYIVFLRNADLYVASCAHFYHQMVAWLGGFQYHIHAYIEMTVHHHLQSAQLENMNNL